MKESIKILAIGLAVASAMSLALVIPSRSHELPARLTPQEMSWIEFCKARGYDVHDNSEDAVNDYLDTWRGSVEEEAALTNLGVELI